MQNCCNAAHWSLNDLRFWFRATFYQKRQSNYEPEENGQKLIPDEQVELPSPVEDVLHKCGQATLVGRLQMLQSEGLVKQDLKIQPFELADEEQNPTDEEVDQLPPEATERCRCQQSAPDYDAEMNATAPTCLLCRGFESMVIVRTDESEYDTTDYFTVFIGESQLIVR